MNRTKKDIMKDVMDSVVESKKVENNTVYYKTENGEERYRHHDTDILKIKDGIIEFNSGGWRSKTTMERMNNFQDIADIHTKGGIWYISTPQSGKRVFFDGIQVDIDGVFLNESEQSEKDILKLKKDAKKYIDNFIEELMNGNVPAPSSGDCWYCLMFESQMPTTDHIYAHIEEGYYVPSLLVRATEKFPVSQAAMAYLNYLWVGENEDNRFYKHFKTVARDQLKHSLRKFVYKKLGFSI